MPASDRHSFRTGAAIGRPGRNPPARGSLNNIRQTRLPYDFGQFVRAQREGAESTTRGPPEVRSATP
ncbi:hypothetical protein ACCAA_270075 [Candidatus Accumulibacter aalborgensis]|uniref:Uncharacterized protein n=1 Tax=Candidatus Accumulibacter aalborgensis TaxID=1860102 RepID=A0A1A8XN22_9PROT|nr:hypothetical protein ACCAA_270075 [Candidatus Accumulibacter aalborgensis]